MEKETNEIVKIWEKSYSKSIKQNQSYQSIDQIRRLAAYFTPGRTFFYIFNLYDMSFEYISDEVEEIMGFPRDEAKMVDLLSISVDLPLVKQKERVIEDFVINHVHGEKLLDYKFVYTHQIQKRNEPKAAPRTILLQSVPLSVNNGKPHHFIAIHTDVTHLKIPISKTISIINMKGGPSYYNLNVEGGEFLPDSTARETEEEKRLTGREKEILQLMAKGLKADEIARRLAISYNTVRTHRNNMLTKMGCANTTEMVVRCMAEGLIGI